MAELEAGTTTGAARARPLSPHLQIYKPMLTMMMSIVHRITGAHSILECCCSPGG